MIYLFCGAPTAGKTTQSTLLSESFEIPLISLGTELRRKAEHDAKTGHIMASGELVPSAMIRDILRDVRTRHATNFIIDGIRLPAEVGYVRQFWPDEDVIAIELDVHADVIRERASVRRNASDKPRPDDDPASVERRIAVFNEALPPLLDAFAFHGVSVIRINGDNERDTVHTEILEALRYASQSKD